MQLPCPQDVLAFGHINIWQYAEYCQPRKMTQTSVFWVFLRVSLYRYDWLNHCLYGWIQSPGFSSSWRSGWYHMAQNPKSLTTCLFFLLWIVHILSHLVSINRFGLRGPPWIKKTLVSLGKFQGINVTSQELGTKANKILDSKNLVIILGTKNRDLSDCLWSRDVNKSVVQVFIENKFKGSWFYCEGNPFDTLVFVILLDFT